MKDQARRKFLAASVQVGKSFVVSLETVQDVLEKPELWIMLSASERQSLELMEKVKAHAQVAKIAVDSSTDFFEKTEILQHTVRFSNGGRIIGLPANPDTARGYSGNVVLDEFAIHRDAKAIWKAMVGRTMRGYKLRVMSSFKGKANKFYDLAKTLGLHEGIPPAIQPVHSGPWSGHLVTIEMAVQQGLKVDIDELRETVGDEEIFLEEFMCVPVDGALDFIPLEMVLACESEEATVGFDFKPRPNLFAGWDIARKRDLSVIWIFEKQGQVLLTVGVVRMARLRFAEQREMGERIAGLVERMAIDTTGIGAQLGEELSEKFPAVIEQVNFASSVEQGKDDDGKPINARVKEVMAVGLKNAMEVQGILLPEEPATRRAFQAVKRFVGPTGNIRYDAARTDAGHADEFWAVALARAAADNEGGNYVPASDCGLVGKSITSGLMGMRF